MLEDKLSTKSEAIDAVILDDYQRLQGKNINKNYGLTQSGIPAIFAALGMPSLETMVNELLDNPDNYTTYVKSITRKGKNRTFKNKVSRKRVLHKGQELNEFRMVTNSMARWM